MQLDLQVKMEVLEHKHQSNLTLTSQLKVTRKKIAEKVENENNGREINLRMEQIIILKLLRTSNKRPLIYLGQILEQRTTGRLTKVTSKLYVRFWRIQLCSDNM